MICLVKVSFMYSRWPLFPQVLNDRLTERGVGKETQSTGTSSSLARQGTNQEKEKSRPAVYRYILTASSRFCSDGGGPFDILFVKTLACHWPAGFSHDMMLLSYWSRFQDDPIWIPDLLCTLVTSQNVKI